MRIYSNPNGLRDSTYYRLTQDKTGRWFVARWPSMLHPNWTKEREEELVEFYGGRDTSGYQHGSSVNTAAHLTQRSMSRPSTPTRRSTTPTER